MIQLTVSASDNSAVINRLKRIEGQVKGIQKMIEEEKDCADILIQITAVRSAINSAGGLVLEKHMKNCLKMYLDGESNSDTLDELIDVMVKYTK